MSLFLESNSLLHDNQFGSREGRSCEMGLSKILSSCAFKIKEGKYTSLVSVGTVEVSGNVEWHNILTQLVALNCPGDLVGVIRSYLQNGTILVNWEHGATSHSQKKDFPRVLVLVLFFGS